MKRNINLQELSRDHHHGLLLGWKIRQGLKYSTSPQVIAEYVSYFSDAALFPHFREEETHILSHLPDNNKFKTRVLSEHKDITGLIKTVSSGPIQTEVLLRIAKQLEDHIRFEERELFPYLEGALTDDVLEQIGEAINSDHEPFVEDYPVEFWKSVTPS